MAWDGHSSICQLLGCDILRYLLLACHNLHAHPELMERELEVLQTSMENHTVKILEMIISHFSYPSILKRAQKSISKVQRQHIDDFLDRKYVGLKGVCDAWTKFVNTVSYKSTVYGHLSDSLCGNAQKVHGLFQVPIHAVLLADMSKRRSSGNHRSLCTEIKQLVMDSRPLPMSLSDRRAIEDLNSRYVEYHKHKPPSPDPDWERYVLGEYIAENGEPDPLCPLVWILDHRAVNVEPDVDIESSERCVEDIDPEILAKAREGAGTIVYWIIPGG
ncbi:hypothetical protein ARMGADRAFT_1091793 [Armillaria gallica]|uniref:Uncharacterized protein n=1 Tax=Armillaria gallica TaxID=47427 RepID=A0A2H3CCU9_ARMGA|nr:hypothetical protein ARMGADRAFT_1091793 [Armillaria gallica]